MQKFQAKKKKKKKKKEILLNSAIFYGWWIDSGIYTVYGEINSYYSFNWNDLIVCTHNVDTLNIYMKKFDAICFCVTRTMLFLHFDSW